MSLDNGYFSGNHLQALEQKQVDAYVTTDKGEKIHKTPLSNSERKPVKTDFSYDKIIHTLAYPGGQTLPQICGSKEGNRSYQGSSETCAACPLKSRRCQSEKGRTRHPHYR